MPNRKGFTLIELIITVAIIGILIGAAVPNIVAYRDRYRAMELQKHTEIVNKALVQYYAFTGAYPNQGRDDTIDLTAGELDTLKNELKYKTSVNLDTDRYIYNYDKYDDPGHPGTLLYSNRKLLVKYK